MPRAAGTAGSLPASAAAIVDATEMANCNWMTIGYHSMVRSVPTFAAARRASNLLERSHIFYIAADPM